LAIESALHQDAGPLEIIVVDDGSGPDTQRMLDEHGDVIRVIRQDHAGRSTARNRGAAAASGEILAFLDSDDVWRPNHISASVARLEVADDAVLCASPVQAIGPDGATVDAPRLRATFDRAAACGFPPERLVLGSGLYTSGVCIRRDAFAATNGFEASMSALEDLDLYLRLRRLGTFVATAEATVLYRVHAGNTDAHDMARGALTIAARHRPDARSTSRRLDAALAAIAARAHGTLGEERQLVRCAVDAVLADPATALAAGVPRLLAGSVARRARRRLPRRGDDRG
jgi:glycosyltransferase involved in cell wall biosynthesis